MRHGGARVGNRRAILLAAVLWVVVAASVSAQGGASSAGLLRGVLRDGLTRLPVAVAGIRLIARDGNTIATAFSDSAGRFQIRVAAAGTYRLAAERIGYETMRSQPLAIAAGDTLTLEVRISPSAVLLDSILVRAEQEPRPVRAGEQLIHGRLLDDATREPIPQGTIRLLLENGQTAATAITDAQGLFRLISPRPATYVLRGERIGYQTSEQKALHLMPGDTLRIDFHLSAQAALLAPILVTASAREVTDRYRLVGMDDFMRRMGRYSKSRLGSFLTRDSIRA
jgi:carboxypeptidase family protein